MTFQFVEIAVWGVYLSSAVIGILVGTHDWIRCESSKSNLNIKRLIGGSVFLLSLPLLGRLIVFSPETIVGVLLWSLTIGLIVVVIATVGMILWFSDAN